MSGAKRGSGTRSNLYSRSKFTNWTPFDPYWSEAKASRSSGRPAATVYVSQGSSLPIFANEPHPSFVQPCNPEDVREVLRACPAEFLAGLEGVFLLSGTSKQARTLKLFRYGTYAPGRVFLHAYPTRYMAQHFDTPFPPHLSREFTRWGADVAERSGKLIVRFDSSSLRRFYLYDVLLHELGHHVDDRAFSRPDKAAERFAEWFAQEQARRLKE